MKKLLIVLAFVFPGLSFAQVAAQDSAFQRFMVEASGAGKQTISFGSNGTPVLSPGVPTLSTNGGPDLAVSRTGSFTNPSGNRVAGTATAKVTKAAIGPLIAKAAASLNPLAALLVAGGAIYEVYKEAGGFEVFFQPDGTQAVRKSDPSVCTVAPCYQYNTRIGAWPIGYGSTMASSAQAAADNANSLDANYLYTYTGHSGNTASFTLHRRSNGSYFTTQTFSTGQVSAPPSPTTWLPSSQQEFIDAVAAKSGWPTSSRLAEAVAESQKITQDTLPYDPASMTFTGPSTSPGTTSTTTNPDGTTTTTTTTHNHTYQGNQVTTSTVTNTTNNNPTTNVTTVTTTNSTPESAPPLELETCGLPGKPACKIDETGTKDGVAERTAGQNEFNTEQTKLDNLIPEIIGATPDTSWGLTPFFLEQSGTCHPITLIEWPSFVGGGTFAFDICPWLPLALKLMSLLWVVTTIGACVSLVRDTMTAA